eukprot:TRINITY_DN690_c0_g4_i1.p1 TRINITY_DN690_c0_g4~~TRINITY_DN690_c0_g4_i1.p1  ORF type:complete len:364 (+),score=94.21 TRINITY_DN690_c0_g4_i1:58-1092(+)
MDAHYRTLGLAPGATTKQIRAEYKARALRLHPDKNPGGEAAFRQLQLAYEALCDTDARERYAVHPAAQRTDTEAAMHRAAASAFRAAEAARQAHAPRPPPCNVSDILNRDAHMMGLGGGTVHGGARELLRRQRTNAVSLDALLREQAKDLPGRVRRQEPTEQADSPREPSSPPAPPPRRCASVFPPCQQGGGGAAMRTVYERLCGTCPRIALDPSLRWRAEWESLSAAEEAERQELLRRLMRGAGSEEARYRAFADATAAVLARRRAPPETDATTGGTGTGSGVRAAWLNAHRARTGCAPEPEEPPGGSPLDFDAAQECAAQAARYKNDLLREFRRRRAHAAAP